MSTVKTNNVQVGQSGTATNNFTLYQPTVPDGTVRLGNGNSGATTSDVITATSAGNVGIGATSIPSGYKLLVGSSSTNAGIELFKTGSGAQGGYLNLRPSLAAGNEYNLSISAYDHSGDSNTDGISINAFDGVSFCTGSNTRQERARIDSSGNLLVGTTSNPNSAKIAVGPTASNGISIESNSTSVVMSQLLFRNPNGIVGSVTTSGSSTAYNTSSDYRLKHDIQPMTGALAKVAALKPVIYKWNVDNSAGEGFIAHELQAVVPDAVTGEKDAVDADGNIVPQGIDTSFLVATLTAAIQELNAKVEALEAKLAQTGA